MHTLNTNDQQNATPCASARSGPSEPRSATEAPSFDIGAVRAIAARGDPVTAEQVLALCHEVERWQRQASAWTDNIADLTRERDALLADASDIRRKARRYLSVKKSWDNRLHELVVLRAALEDEHPGAPLLALLDAARAWAGALKAKDGGEIERCANELILAIARCG